MLKGRDPSTRRKGMPFAARRLPAISRDRFQKEKTTLAEIRTAAFARI